VKIHEFATNPTDGQVERPMILDPGKRRLHSADGYGLRRGSGVFIVAEDESIYRGTVRRIDFDQRTVVVNIESYDLGDGFSFLACPALGVDEFRLDL
jgi:hypothetical protein